MNGARTFATAGRVLRQLSHDPRSIALMLVAPSLLVGLFAWLFSDQEGVFDIYGPPILALFPFIIMFLITSITTLRERRSGTLERLMTTPLGKADFIVGYALAFGLMAMLQAIVTVTFAVWVCGLETEGPVWQLGLVAVTDAVLGMALGLLASAFARTEFQAVQFMPLIVFPQILLGGLFMPREEMPEALYAISKFLPLSYAIDAINAVTAGDEGWDVYGPLLVVLAFLVGSLILASLTLRRRTQRARVRSHPSVTALGRIASQSARADRRSAAGCGLRSFAVRSRSCVSSSSLSSDIRSAIARPCAREPAEQSPPRLGRAHQRAAAVVGVGALRDQAARGHAVDEPRDARLADEHVGGDVAQPRGHGPRRG